MELSTILFSSSSSFSTDCICWSFLSHRSIQKSRLVVNSIAAVSLVREEEHGMGRKGYKQVQQPLVIPITKDNHTVEPKRRLGHSKVQLHFLEERDEGILSERMLNLSRNNKVRSAIELFNSMDASGLKPNAHACNSLISCLIRNGSVDNALRIFETVRKKEMVTGHTYSLVLKAVASCQGCDAAMELFRSLEDDEVSEKKFDIIVYNTMISISGKAKKWIETERLWRKLKKNGLSGTTITYSLLISIFVQCGQTELAVDAYHELSVNRFNPSEDNMKAIIASCTKEGKWVFALNVFKEMLSSGVKVNMVAYNSLINCLGKAGEDELAFKIYEQMKSSGHTPDLYTWSALLSSLYRSQRYADALQLFGGIKTQPGVQLNDHLYNIALMSCQKLGLWERSVQILWEMEASGLQMSTVSYNHVIHACEVARKPKVALQVYQHMIHLKNSPDTFTYLSLIRVCVWGSLWTDVEKIMECVIPDASLYNALVHGFCLRGKFTLAKKLYTQMRSIGLKPDGKTRALMLQHLPDNGARRHPRARCIQRGYQ